MKIVLIGAGSRSFGRGQIADILHSKELDRSDVTLTLVDVDAAALDLMTKLAMRMRDHLGGRIVIESTTDRTQALPGADYVVMAVEVKRWELWEQDFRIPLTYGFRHSLGENAGPGGLFHSLRSLEVVLPIARDIERLCPDAWLFSFTNPEARVLHAVSHLTKVKAAGFCHGVFTALEVISEYTGVPREELDVHSAGINHFYTVLKARNRSTGEDYMDLILAKAAKDTANPHRRMFAKMAEVFGVFTFPSEDHIGEFLSFGADYMGTKWIYGIESRKLRKDDGAAETPFEDYAEGRAPLDEGMLSTTGELTVPVICDMELDRGSFRDAVNVLNTEGFIGNLPMTGAVEVPATVDAAGLHPLHVGNIPEPFATFMRRQLEINELVTEAFRTRSRRLLLQALLLDPIVTSVSAAEALLDDMLALQSEFLGTYE